MMTWQHVIAFVTILPAAATFYFFVFWRWFGFWRKHRTLTYAFFGGTFVAVGVSVAVAHQWTFAGRLTTPFWMQALGWLLIVAATIFGTIADRQIGLRVRSFMPFFDDHGHLSLKTNGAYGVVRHPIYAAGSWFQLGGFLVTGYPAIMVAWAVFTLGATWFARR